MPPLQVDNWEKEHTGTGLDSQDAKVSGDGWFAQLGNVIPCILRSKGEFNSSKQVSQIQEGWNWMR